MEKELCIWQMEIKLKEFGKMVCYKEMGALSNLMDKELKFTLIIYKNMEITNRSY
jgi:hypothetical protein